jgi:hypothetical protein
MKLSVSLLIFNSTCTMKKLLDLLEKASMKLIWIFIFVLGFSNSFAKEKVTSFLASKSEMSKIVNESLSTKEEKAKGAEFINQFYSFIESTKSQLTVLNKELDSTDVSLIWAQANYFDKSVLDKTIAEHNRLVKNQNSMNRIYYGAKKEAIDMIKNSILNPNLKKEMIDGFTEEMYGSDVIILIDKRQELFKKLIKINGSVIEFVKRNFGKLVSDNGNFYFRNEKDISQYNDFVSQYTKVKSDIDDIYKKSASLRNLK